MSSKKSPISIAARFTVANVSAEAIQLLKTWISSKTESHLVVEEVGSETELDHWHACFVSCSFPTMKALRSSFTRENPDFVGNERHSLKLWKDQAQLAYICKGVQEKSLPSVVMLHGLYDVSKLHDEYWSGKAQARRKRTRHWFDDVMDTVRGKRWTYHGNRSEIFKLIATNCPSPTPFRMEHHMCAVFRELDTEDFVDQLYRRCEDRLL